MTSKYCVNKKSANINIYASVDDFLEVKAPCEIRLLIINGWFVNPYVSYRPDDNCNPRNWDGYSLEDENPNSQYEFIPVGRPSTCGYFSYRIGKDGIVPNSGDIFLSIIPNGFSFEAWKQRVVIIDGDKKEVFRKDYPLSDEIKFDVNCIDGCPDGYMEIKIDKYPGYCCVKCDDLVNKVNKMIAKL